VMLVAPIGGPERRSRRCRRASRRWARAWAPDRNRSPSPIGMPGCRWDRSGVHRHRGPTPADIAARHLENDLLRRFRPMGGRWRSFERSSEARTSWRRCRPADCRRRGQTARPAATCSSALPGPSTANRSSSFRNRHGSGSLWKVAADGSGRGSKYPFVGDGSPIEPVATGRSPRMPAVPSKTGISGNST
jgi:hypothetical protein